jgi:hypothetical protein
VIGNLCNAATLAESLRNRKDAASVALYQNALKNFEVGAFLMSMTVTHELVHRWVHYLQGYTGVGTPEHIHFPGMPNGGESGWVWEKDFLGGGRLVTHEDRNDPLGWQQLGKIYLFRHTTDENIAMELPRNYMQKILNFGKCRKGRRTE